MTDQTLILPSVGFGGQQVFCGAWIAVPGDPDGTYCKNLVGHSGPHATRYPKASAGA